MKKVSLFCALVALAALLTAPAFANEGMWQPHQLPELADQLKELGLELDPSTMTDLTSHPMNAVISLGGCTASFVSPDGLVVTNHHCAYGSLQYNSSEDANLLKDGFLAVERGEEIFAGPGSRVLVTTAVEDVSAKIQKGLDKLSPLDRYKTIDDRRKTLIAECEEDQGHRCRVSSFHGGLEYRLIKQLEIRDVRIVYAPAGSVGKYGGDIDNWMWPRHTGDYAFYRAYVDKDGNPADYSEDNVAFAPKHHLQVTSEGLNPGDYVMVAGYPGRTNRYRLAMEVEDQFAWTYPVRKKLFGEMLDIIDSETAERPDAGIKYAGMVAGLNNAMKNYEGMLNGYAKSDMVERKQKSEAALAAWVDADKARKAEYGAALDDLRALIAERRATRERDTYYGGARRATLLGTAARLYRNSHEQKKPNAERESGYQERDMLRMKEGLQRIDRRYDAQVDQAIWQAGILHYVNNVPTDQRVEAFDKLFGINGHKIDEDALNALLEKAYSETELDDGEVRLAWMEKSPADFEKSNDPFIKMAVALYEDDRAREEENKERSGRFNELRPKYMAATIAQLNEQGKAVYPDANSTLRVTFGTVRGYSPADAVAYTPFTSVKGLLQKETGEDPFDSPPAVLDAVREERFGNYVDKNLGSVPINFLSDVDTTGGNSGSPTMNGKGELVGLLFDGNWESIISDWDFLPDVTRSIHVDIRYTLWIMDHVDRADHLLKEMGLEAAPDEINVARPDPVGQ